MASFEPFGLPFVWINMATDTEKVPKGKKVWGNDLLCATLSKQQC